MNNGPQSVRVSYHDIKNMLAALDKLQCVKDEKLMNILINYESCGGIGCNLEMKVEGIEVAGIKSNLTVPLVSDADW